jgi:hypothetical protein
MLVIERLAFLRKEDPAHEYRELLLYQVEGHFKIWEVIGFCSELAMRRAEIALGSEAQMRVRLSAEAQRLCGEGFARCDPRLAEDD